jgi:hypothetical protein
MIVEAPWFISNTFIRVDLQTPTVKEEIGNYSSQYSARLSVHLNDLVANLLCNQTTGDWESTCQLSAYQTPSIIVFVVLVSSGLVCRSHSHKPQQAKKYQLQKSPAEHSSTYNSISFAQFAERAGTFSKYWPATVATQRCKTMRKPPPPTSSPGADGPVSHLVTADYATVATQRCKTMRNPPPPTSSPGADGPVSHLVTTDYATVFEPCR